MTQKYRLSRARAESPRIGARRIVFNRIFQQTRLSCPHIGLALLTVLCLSAPESKARLAEGEQQWVAPALEAQRKNPVPATESSLGAGRKIYLDRCAACHGQTGEGDGPDAVDLGLRASKFSDPAVRDQSDGAFFWKITTGKKPMPNYGSRLSPTDCWNVINYFKTLIPD